MGNQLVPLSNAPNQSLVVPLNIDGGVTDLYFRLVFNEVAQYWVITILDASGNILLDSIPLITGNAPAANVLGQFKYMNLGSAQIINASGKLLTNDYPTKVDLGTDFVLIWGDTPA